MRKIIALFFSVVYPKPTRVRWTFTFLLSEELNERLLAMNQDTKATTRYPLKINYSPTAIKRPPSGL